MTATDPDQWTTAGGVDADAWSNLGDWLVGFGYWDDNGVWVDGASWRDTRQQWAASAVDDTTWTPAATGLET